MNYYSINESNIDKDDICCAMSNAKSLVKKAWLKERFKEGLVFYKSEERGKCFIEYIPSEYAWAPIQANNFMYINCLWVSGKFKRHGYSSNLLNQCIEDAKKQGKQGICILSSTGRKKEFLSDPKYLSYKGFIEADTTSVGINLMYLPLVESCDVPTFKSCAISPQIKEEGFVLYYSDQCPFTDYWVNRIINVAKEQDIHIKLNHITTLQDAQNAPTPFTTYTLFKNGEFITHSILSDKKFLALL